MNENKMETYWELEKSFLQELEDEKDEILKLRDEDEQRERISEIVDSSIPVYTQSLLEIAISEPWLAVDEPELMAFSGKGAIACIGGNIYQNLQEKGQEWLDEVKK